MRQRLTPDSLNKIEAELTELDRFIINIQGKKLRPSQCYRFIADPPHILFNTNCPSGLSLKIQAILEKYTVRDEPGDQPANQTVN